MPNLPMGRVDEVLVHPRENDLILSTHSHSVWILDDVSALQHLTPDVLAKDAALLPTRDAVRVEVRPAAQRRHHRRQVLEG